MRPVRHPARPSERTRTESALATNGAPSQPLSAEPLSVWIMRVRNGDVSLNVLVDGDDDAPPLLLLHGILGCAETWDWMVPRVVDWFRVLRLDLRGHGGSDRAPGEYQEVSYVSDAIAVCEQVAATPAVVIGHSLGGGIAAGLAQTRPDLVRGAVLEEAGFHQPDTSSAMDEENSLLDSFRTLREMIPELQAAGMTAGRRS